MPAVFRIAAGNYSQRQTVAFSRCEQLFGLCISLPGGNPDCKTKDHPLRVVCAVRKGISQAGTSAGGGGGGADADGGGEEGGALAVALALVASLLRFK